MPAKKHFEKRSSIYDLDLFCLDTNSNLNPDCNLGNEPARCRYFSPHSFSKFKHTVHNDQDGFSLLHNNVRSLKHNLENLHVHLLHELDYNFSVIGVTETKKKTSADSLNFLTQNYLTTNLNMFQHLYHVEVLEFTSEAA